MKRILSLLTVLALLCCAAPAPAESLEDFAGASLTALDAGTLDGGAFTQEDIAAADLTLMNIWATTCPPCLNEMPELGTFAAALPERVRFVGVCLDAATLPDAVSQYLDRIGFRAPTISVLGSDLENLVYTRVMYTPTTLCISSDGQIVDVLIGSPTNVEEVYTALANGALDKLGLPRIEMP